MDVLPSRLSFPEAWEMRDDAADGRPMWALVGVGGDELLGSGTDLADGIPSFVVAGPPKSGRSTLLRSMARALLTQGSSVVVVAPRQSPLRQLAGQPGVVASFEKADLSAADLQEALDRAPGPVTVLIDDAELLKEAGAGSVLKEIISFGGERGRALVIGGASEDLAQGFSGWHIDARKGRRGALLSPQAPMDGDLIGVRLPRSVVGGQVQAGRAMVHLGDGELRMVQVPVD